MVASPAQAAPIDFLKISDAANWEGGDLVFNVTYTGTAATTTFDFAIVNDGSASVDDTDPTLDSPYFDTSSTNITFTAASASQPARATVTVHALDAGASDLPSETFHLVATPDGQIGSTPSSKATGTIWNLDPANDVVLSGNTTVPETAVNGVQKVVTVTATSTHPQPHDVVVPVKTADITDGTDYQTDMATPDGGPNRDYTALPADAAIVIPANQTTGTISVQLWDDTSDEADTQYFNVVQDTDPTRPTLGGAVVQDTVRVGIKDDDAQPTVTIGDATTAQEGGRLTFPLKLSNPSEKGVSVDLDAAGVATGSAGDATVAAVDDHGTTDAVDVLWNNASGHNTVDVPLYAASTNVMMPITTNPGTVGHYTFEGPENVRATISNAANSTLGAQTTANGVITDTGAGELLELSSANGTAPAQIFSNGYREWTEGNNGPVEQKIYLKLTSGTLPTTLNYSFVDGTATNGTDYIGKSGTITVPASGTPNSTVSVPVTIIGDRIDEMNETFKLLLTDANGIADSTTIGEQPFTINDDDTAPSWTTSDVTVTEGDSGQTMARVPVSLSGPAAADVTFSAMPINGSAKSGNIGVDGNDYSSPALGNVTIKAGATVGYLDVPINGDQMYERDESFTVLFGAPGGVTTTADTVDTARVTIKNDDAQPTITFGQYSGPEGGTIQVTGTVTGSSQYPYTVGFTVAGNGDNPATPGTDFDVPTGLATDVAQIPAGFTGALTDPLVTGFTPLSFVLDGDSIDEATETFGVKASETTSPLMGFMPSTATVKIADDPLDLPPMVSLEDVSIGEGEKSVDIPVDLTFTSDNDATSTSQPVTVQYTTVDGAAKAGQDYKATKSTLSIPAGTLKSKINIPVIDDMVKENGEDFFVKVSSVGPTGATLGKAISQVIIKDNDGGGGTTPPPSNGSLTISAPTWVTGSVAVPVTGKADAGATVDLWGAAWSPANPKLVKLDSTTADKNGNYKFSRWVGTGYRFQVAVGDEMSDVVKVGLNQAPVFVASSPSKGKLSVAIQGNPRGPKQVVIVQVWSGGKWVNTWKGMTGTNNVWKATVSQKSKSSWTLRAFVQGDMNWGINGGYSAAKKVTIK
ncbi:Calx-beta domain-containing protein [Actinoplanes sp. NPDC051343]|uniref:Calx-beta domain-containing protein n=1 Tax=Actinoplanes sp. NPDC051343 TaxID=3363906 RepID=UPI0037AF4BD4